MRFATYKGEENPAELASRLLQIEGPESKELTERAEAALLKTNPNLRDIRKMAIGDLIIVPEVAGARPRAETSPADIGVPMIKELQHSLAKLVVSFNDALDREFKELTRTLETIKNQQLQEVAENSEELKERFASIESVVNARMGQIEPEKKRIAAVFNGIKKDLDQLTERL